MNLHCPVPLACNASFYLGQQAQHSLPTRHVMVDGMARNILKIF
jgi:hypothetical protein